MKKDLWNRDRLKHLFSKGSSPSEAHFGYLIDSMINKIDDGFDKTSQDGLQLTPTGDTGKVLSVFKNQGEQQPNWQLSLDKDSGALSFDHLQQAADGKVVNTTNLVLGDDGRVGIEGVLSIRTRVGAFVGQVPGDGKWHDVLSNLDDVHAFEVLARIDGAKGRGKYALTHAIALSTFGGSCNRVKQVRAYYGWFWNRIEFRWHGKETRRYSLQVRTRSHYGLTEGAPYMIRFQLTQLWDDSIFKGLGNPEHDTNK